MAATVSSIPLSRASNTQDRHDNPIVRELRACYLEMPGTILTVAQACRLTGSDETSVGAALDKLVHDGFLREIDPKRYARDD